MPAPQTDVDQIRRWAAGKIPEQFAPEMRIDVEVAGPTVTVVDVRAPWNPDGSPTWDRQEVAKMRWTEKYGTWALYWPDRNGKWHLYDRVPPTAKIGTHLAELDADPTCIFWG